MFDPARRSGLVPLKVVSTVHHLGTLSNPKSFDVESLDLKSLGDLKSVEFRRASDPRT